MVLARYRIQQGSFDDFTIDNQTGLISIARKLDYDKRENYRIEVVASDLGKNFIEISSENKINNMPNGFGHVCDIQMFRVLHDL